MVTSQFRILPLFLMLAIGAHVMPVRADEKQETEKKQTEQTFWQKCKNFIKYPKGIFLVSASTLIIAYLYSLSLQDANIIEQNQARKNAQADLEKIKDNQTAIENEITSLNTIINTANNRSQVALAMVRRNIFNDRLTTLKQTTSTQSTSALNSNSSGSTQGTSNSSSSNPQSPHCFLCELSGDTNTQVTHRCPQNHYYCSNCITNMQTVPVADSDVHSYRPRFRCSVCKDRNLTPIANSSPKPYRELEVACPLGHKIDISTFVRNSWSTSFKCNFCRVPYPVNLCKVVSASTNLSTSSSSS